MPTSLYKTKFPAPDRALARQSKPVSKLAIACTIGALLAFVALDVANRLFVPIDHYAVSKRSWIWWAVRDFRLRKKTPDTVLLGSSLMMAVQNDGDATFLDQPLDALKHWRTLYLEYKLRTMLKKEVTTGSFVIGGEMVSDADAIYRAMYRDTAPPRTIIWGIAPRDFVDSTFCAPEESPIVGYMSQITGDRDLLETGHIPFWSQIDDALSTISALYARRAQYFAALRDLIGTGFSDCFPAAGQGTTPALRALPQASKIYQADDNAPGEWVTMPYGEKPVTTSDNSAEYRQRYQPFKPSVFQEQIFFARKFLAQAQKRGTRVIVVNMPLQQKNIDLLPSGVYSNYLQAVKTVAKDTDTKFIDLNAGGLFQTSDFADPVHLNGIGAIKFFNYLCERWTD